LDSWAEVPDVNLIQRIVPAQVDKGFDPEEGDPPPEGSVVIRPYLMLAMIKGTNGITYDIRWIDEVAGNCERHAEYKT